ncbi:MAG: hypothetical protein ABI024_17055, partial [Vicinamibacterales bacterium]
MSAALICGAAPALAQETRLPRLFLDDTIQQRSALSTPAAAHRPAALGARIAIADFDQLPALQSYLDAAAAARIAVWLAIDAPPQSLSIADWRSRLRAVTARSSSLAVLEIVFSTADAGRVRFVVELASTEARAGSEKVLVAAGGADAAGFEAVIEQIGASLAAYLDVVVVDQAWWEQTAPALESARALAPGLQILARRSAQDPSEIVAETMRMLGTEVLSASWRAAPATMTAAIVALAPAAGLLMHPVEVIDPASVGFQVTAQPSGSALPPCRLLFDAESFATYLSFDGGARDTLLTVELHLAAATTPIVYELISGRALVPPLSARDEATSRTRVTLTISGHATLVDFSAGGAEPAVDRSQVTAARTLSVAEVIARHRRQQARQDALLTSYRASARMEQHFRPSLTDPGYDVVTENDFFVEGQSIEWEEMSFSVNGSKWGADRPAFPLLQAEKVLSLPLDLRLDEDYRYELNGLDRVDGVDCYRVNFEPLGSSAALYKGTVWIDRATFAKLRVQAVQTRVAPPIASNEEQLDYRPVGASGVVPLYALTAQSASQIILIAGRNLLLEKATRFENFQVNDDRFQAWRDAARRGNRIMYRDTDQGLRYLVKQGVDRVVSDALTTSAKAMAMGVLVDPSYAFPIPIFGINYLDFELRGRNDTQFAMLFGGVFAAGNVQRSRIGRTHFDASLDFFAIAVPSSDRLYLDDGEREDERLLSWSVSSGVNAGWQASAFEKWTLQYQLRFDPFVRDRTTAESYVVPSSTFTHGIGGAWEYKRGGYSGVVNGTWHTRMAWRPWGPEGTVQSTPRHYVKYAAHLSKDVFLNTFQKIHLNAAFFGGSGLDRFSRWQFGLFDDTRIHGVPGAGIRFDELGMVRGSYSFNIFEQYRLDLFVDQAWGRDRSAGREWRPITGLGAAINLRAPFNTILRADIGKSLLPGRYARIGSVVAQVMV